jgi:high-affinity iron transporter
MGDWSAALPTFVITLREGVEAALVVGIVLAYLQKVKRTHLNPWVYAGIGVGLVASVLVGGVLIRVLQLVSLSTRADAPFWKALLEGSFSLGAMVLLGWMLVWMTRQARSLKADMESTLATTLESAETPMVGVSILGLIAIAVLREGFETVLFIAAKFQEGWIPILGAIAGLVGAVAIGILLFWLGIRINVRRFFQVMGILLLFIVAGLSVTTLRHFDTALQIWSSIHPNNGAFCPSLEGSCWLGLQVWDASAILPDREFPGVLLKAFFGYTQRLYLVQAIAYGVTLTTIGRLYFNSLQQINLPKTSPSSSSAIAEPKQPEPKAGLSN